MRFRLDQNGVLYDLPVTSDKGRYSEKKTSGNKYGDEHERLREILDDFMAIEPEYRYSHKDKAGKKKNGGEHR